MLSADALVDRVLSVRHHRCGGCMSQELP